MATFKNTLFWWCVFLFLFLPLFYTHVVVHELGHLVVALLLNLPVKEFSIGTGELVGWFAWNKINFLFYENPNSGFVLLKLAPGVNIPHWGNFLLCISGSLFAFYFLAVIFYTFIRAVGVEIGYWSYLKKLHITIFNVLVYVLCPFAYLAKSMRKVWLESHFMKLIISLKGSYFLNLFLLSLVFYLIAGHVYFHLINFLPGIAGSVGADSYGWLNSFLNMLGVHQSIYETTLRAQFFVIDVFYYLFFVHVSFIFYKGILKYSSFIKKPC